MSGATDLPLLAWQRSPILPVSPTVTQEQAAARIKWRVTGMRQTIYRMIKEAGERGATDDEIQRALDIEGSTERPRRRELEIAGHIVNAEKVRANSRGNNETVWVVK